MPPLAITGTVSARASATVASMFDATHHAVAADVGVNDRLDSVVLKLLREVEHVMPRHLRPAFHRHLPVPGIESHHDVARECIAGIVQETRAS